MTSDVEQKVAKRDVSRGADEEGRVVGEAENNAVSVVELHERQARVTDFGGIAKLARRDRDGRDSGRDGFRVRVISVAGLDD